MMNKNTVLENNLVCTTAVVDYKNEIEETHAWLKQREEDLRERAANNGGEITEDDIREGFGFEK